MQQMKDSKIPWVGQMPGDWSVEKGKYCFFNRKDIVGVKADDYERLALTLNGVVKRPKEDNTGLQPEKFETYQILRPDELVFKLIDLQNVSTSRVGYSKYKGIVSPAYIILKGKGKVLTKFAEKYYLMLWMYEIFNHLGDSGVRSSLNCNELLEIPLCFPSLEKQQLIADFLDKKCGEIDGLIADIEKEIEVLTQYKKSIITETVTKGLNKNTKLKSTDIKWLPFLPESWSYKKAKYLFVQRTTKGNKYLQLLSPTQKFGVIPQELYEELSGMVAVKVNEKTDLGLFKTINKGDFCISLRSFEGGFEFSNYDGVVSPAYTVFYPKINCHSQYFKYLFKTQIFIDEMNSYSLSLRDGKPISFFNFGNTYIPLPTIQEQKEIAEYLDKKCKDIDSVLEDKNKQLENLASYKKSIIYEYVTGKKEVI